MKKFWQVGIALLCTVAMTTGCADMSARQKGFLKGAAVGAVVGGGAGAAIGNRSDNGNRDAATGNGAMIGIASGALVGGIIGALMAKEEVKPPAPAPKVETPPPPAAPMPEPKVETPPPPVVKEKIVLRGINFDFDKSNIKKEFIPILEQAVEILKAHPGVKVIVEGYCDGIGTEAYNMKLSERRANSVKQFLVKNGISADNIQTVGYGKTHPIASNKTAEGRAMNRRVEFKILD
ncbi:MAG: OmpA family protein [Dissulfurimicrobium sp.]|uniref:OmpA family protein n=1 Tax=Dissulfurimicrobium sp. TaxID=2022436 RepID=UPI00404A47C1